MEGGGASDPVAVGPRAARDWRRRIDLSLRRHHTIQICQALFPLPTYSPGMQFQAARLERDFFNACSSASEYVTQLANFVYFVHHRRSIIQEMFLNDFVNWLVHRYRFENIGLAMPNEFPSAPSEYEPPAVIRPIL